MGNLMVQGNTPLLCQRQPQFQEQFGERCVGVAKDGVKVGEQPCSQR